MQLYHHGLREPSQDVSPRRHAEKRPREWRSFLSSSGKRLRKAPSRESLSSRNHARGGAQTAQERSPELDSAPLIVEPNEEITANQKCVPLSSSVENLTYKASERELSQSSPQDLTKALLLLRAEVQLLSKTQERLGKQENGLALAQEEVSRLKHELEKAMEQASEAENAKNKAVRSLAEASIKADPYRYDDAFFRKEIIGLRYEINHWVCNQRWQVNRNRIIPERFKVLERTTRYYLDYISSESGMRLLVEARIWQFLVGVVFEKDLWVDGGQENQEVDEIRSGYRTVKDMLVQNVSREQYELYQDWRSVTARIMAKRNMSFTKNALNNTIHHFSTRLKKDLRPFADKDLDSEKSRSLFRGTKTKTDDFIRRSIGLDAIIQCQRPVFSFQPDSPEEMQKLNMKFSEVSMDALDDDGDLLPEGKQVKLVLNPGLCKYGNSAGRNYAQGCTILKSQVDVVGTD